MTTSIQDWQNLEKKKKDERERRHILEEKWMMMSIEKKAFLLNKAIENATDERTREHIRKSGLSAYVFPSVLKHLVSVSTNEFDST